MLMVNDATIIYSKKKENQFINLRRKQKLRTLCNLLNRRLIVKTTINQQQKYPKLYSEINFHRNQEKILRQM